MQAVGKEGKWEGKKGRSKEEMEGGKEKGRERGRKKKKQMSYIEAYSFTKYVYNTIF